MQASGAKDHVTWKQRFVAPYILWAQLAEANPERGLVVTNKTGEHQLYAWEVKSNQLRQLTSTPEGRMSGSISPDGRYIYYLDDRQGNEIGHFMRIPFEGGEPEDITPNLPLYSSLAGVSLSKNGNRLAFVGADRQGFRLYVQDLSPSGELSEPRILYHSHRFSGLPLLPPDGELVVIHSTERSGKMQYSLIAFDAVSGEKVSELWEGGASSLEAVAFSPVAGDQRLVASTDQSGVKRPLIWNPYTGQRTDLELGQLPGEVTALDWSDDSNSLLLCQFDRAVQQLYRYDLTTHSVTRLDHPGGSFGLYGANAAHFAPNDEIFALWQDSTHPSSLIALDGQTGKLKRTVLAAGEVPASRPLRSISFTSSDSQEIQGWLALPEGDGPFPTILNTHGGPHAVMTEVFAPSAQVWLDYGYAFLSINYRGSVTFGREFKEKIWGDLGHWEMEDVVAARDWLVQEKIARPEQILLQGGSYGGYLTLLGLGKRPDLWAGGMALVAIADWAVQYEDSAETLKGVQVALLGGTPQEKPEQYAVSSPVTYAEKVKAPVLIIQGRNDTRTPARPVEQYEAKMKALGKSIEVHWFESGHGGSSAQVKQALANQELMLDFARRTLQGTQR